ncbi:hypothetical protein K5D53_22415 [Pseudomonas cichorii]|nr:hypothetical protein [Pseudomonas cichorii]MBX8596771.1 hypothetical protein [Pseudomonas cichorii]
MSSSWVKQFESHIFKKTWSSILSTLEDINQDPESYKETEDSLSRLNKIMSLIDTTIEILDLDIAPKILWDNCHTNANGCLNNLLSYKSRPNPTSIDQANLYADNLISLLSPYKSLSENANPAYLAEARNHHEQTLNNLKSLDIRIKAAQLELEKTLESSKLHRDAIEIIKNRTNELNRSLFEDSEDAPSIEKSIKKLSLTVESHHRSVEIYRARLLDGPDSISANIQATQKDAVASLTEIQEALSLIQIQKTELANIYDDVVGVTAQDGSFSKIGIRQEIETSRAALSTYEEDQKKRHQALAAQIETLLPGATSAGLAYAYKKLKDQFKTPISRYTIAFYCAMFGLFFSGLILITKSLTLWPFNMELISASNWEELLPTILMRTPILIPIVWLAIFSATRRNQYERLQQEYAHKEAFSSSYESYKKQLQDLKIEPDELQKELLSKAIEAISFNASKTLDGKHVESPPFFQLLEKLNADEIKKLVDMIRGK